MVTGLYRIGLANRLEPIHCPTVGVDGQQWACPVGCRGSALRTRRWTFRIGRNRLGHRDTKRPFGGKVHSGYSLEVFSCVSMSLCPSVPPIFSFFHRYTQGLPVGLSTGAPTCHIAQIPAPSPQLISDGKSWKLKSKAVKPAGSPSL